MVEVQERYLVISTFDVARDSFSTEAKAWLVMMGLRYTRRGKMSADRCFERLNSDQQQSVCEVAGNKFQVSFEKTSGI